MVKLPIMNEQNTNGEVLPPRLIPSLVSGFNAIANHLYLLLFPIALDLILWFAPHLRIKNLLQPLIAEWGQFILSMSSSEMKEMTRQIQELWLSTADRFNLLTLLRTYPIGIPSLLASQSPLENPAGSPIIIEVPSAFIVLLLWVVFIVVGMFMGCLFFNEVSRLTDNRKRPFSLQQVYWEGIQIFLLTLGLIILILVISIPFSVLMSLIALISPSIAQVALMLVILIGLWFLLPLFFSPHGIFENKQNVFAAMLTSVRLVRFYLPGTSLFIFVAIFVSEGMNILWLLAPETSWVMLVGVAGHAIITTGIVAASFIYYRGGLRWMDVYLKQIAFHQANNIQSGK